MPIYEYVCNDCGERYERIVMNTKKTITCPKCDSARKTVQLSVFAAHSNGRQSPTAALSDGCGCTPRTCGCR